MSGLPWRVAFSLAFFLPTVVHGQTHPSLAGQTHTPTSAAVRISPANFSRRRAQSFLMPRVVRNQSSALLRLRGLGQIAAMPHLLSGNQPWQPVGPAQINTTQFGPVTGRVTSIAIAPWDASGNTVYLGSTGGGVWLSNNAAANDPASVTWRPLTDTPPAFSGVNITSLSMGAVSVQPGTAPNGIVLAGTGDPNDALDSYYGAGILRSADGGTTWNLITQSSDGFSGGLANYSFAGNAFSGFAWSTTNTNLVVAAVTDSYDGLINNINNNGTHNVAVAGLYYSTDAGQTWLLSTIEDGPNQVIQSSQTTIPSVFPGVPATSVVWNPVRQMFYAALEYHGYYQSADGITWTRMVHQPGTSLTAGNCPANPGTLGSNSCTIFRGVLAVQPVTGDMFALTVDVNNVDQGLWQDVCNKGSGGCASPVQFSVKIGDSPLDDSSGAGTIPQGTYNLTLAAVPNGADTLLLAGTADIFRCSLAAGCVWRNTTNTGTCVSGKVAPAQHAIAFLAPPAGQTLPLLYFGNDGGIWRSTDGVNQTGGPCDAGDATHFQNLNSALGSLAEVIGLANSATDADVMLAGFGTNGSAATSDQGATGWSQLLSPLGGLTAIDPASQNNWYATLGPGVAIGQCTLGSNCTAADFGTQPAIGSAQTDSDQSLLYAPYMPDPQDSTNMLVGTCRVWRGPADGTAWSAANAISPMLDGRPEPSCNGNALIRSLAAGGPNMQPGTGSANNGAQVIYAGMAGLLDGGGASVGGHVFATTAANLANGTTQWIDLTRSPVSNEQSYNGVFNPDYFDVSALYVDPHDPTGNTIYAAVQGFGVPHLYYSTNGGTNWTNISKNLPDLPLNDVLVDPNNANVVYVASDGGVFVTQNVLSCTTSGGQCWNALGTGLPMAPAVKLVATAANGGYLRVGTYGRGIWEVPLLSAAPQTTMTVSPANLTFGGQPIQTESTPQTVTVTNSGNTDLIVGNIVVSGDFLETNNCNGNIAAGNACQIQVSFSPSVSGTRTGTLTIAANVSGGQQTVSLSGTGTTQSAIVLMPNSVDFGSEQINTVSVAQQVTISNTSGSAISLASENVTGPFAIQTNTCTGSLASQSGCTVAIVFQPTQTGAASGVLTVVSGQGTQTIGLSGNGVSPAADVLAPMSLNFPSTVENTASAPQTITLTNNGGAALTDIQVQAYGDFSVVNGCGYSLNAQSSCTLTVAFTPHAAGAEIGSILVTDNLRSQTVSLSGTGISAPTDTLSPASLTFPPTVIGQNAPSQAIQLTNSGGSALNQISIQALGTEFTQTNNCGATLSANSSCTIMVSFHAAASGSSTGQIDVSDALRTQEVLLNGSGEAPAQDNLSPLVLNFGDQTVGTISAPQTVTLSNNGQAVLTGIRIQSSNPDFMFTTTCGTSLQPGSSCTIQVVFEPHGTGSDAGILSVIDANRTQQVQLLGHGMLPNVTLSPGNASFGAVGVNISSSAQIFVLSNGSSAALDGISLSLTGSFGESTNCGVSLPAASTCSISVVFDPNATGNQTGALQVNSTDANPLTAVLTGAGIAYDLLPIGATTDSLSSGNTANYLLQLIPVSGSIGTVNVTCNNPPPNATCTVNPATPGLSTPSNIQVSIATGVSAGSGQSTRIRLAGLSGVLPWPLGLLLALSSIYFMSFRRKRLDPQRFRIMTILLLAVALAGITACGKGGGLLGDKASNPLPGNSLTPPGTYTVTVTAAAGGMQRSVSLTLTVH